MMNHYIIENKISGFFSNFNSIAGSLVYLYDSKIDNFYFHWYNPLYQDNTENLFDKYVFQQKPLIPPTNFDKIYTASSVGNLYTFITPIEVFTKVNAALRFYKYFDNEVYKLCNNASVKKAKSLGVHVRGTDHVNHGELLTLEYYFSKIDKTMNNQYDNLFLATDDVKIVKAFEQRYGNRVFVNEGIKRSDTTQGIHFSGFSGKEKLAIDVLTDACSLANCDEILMTASNVSAFVLSVNPNIKYEQIDKHIEFIA